MKATITFPSRSTAKAFATAWGRFSLRGHDLSSTKADGITSVTVHQVTPAESQWIADNTHAAKREADPAEKAIIEKRLYAIRKGELDHAEELITTDEARIPAAREWAEANGFDRFRIATFTPGEMPSFAKAVTA